ncbi:DNA replication protein DnaC [Streptomyces sp. 846.5]|nr:ATP-binding protein [Streptomyces sp. 846.5]TDT95337.1 DNA replication protein DnaC [Streptomyces sp. 846.5]
MTIQRPEAELSANPQAHISIDIHAADYPGDVEARIRIDDYIQGELRYDQLLPAEAEFVRYAHEQAVRQRTLQAIAQFTHEVPPRYHNVSVTDADVVEWAQQVAKDPRNTRSQLILGATGTGKTHRAYSTIQAVIVAVMSTGARRAPRWKATTEADLYAALRPSAGGDSEAKYREYASTPLLLLDDLGASKDTEWTEEILYRLINHRYEQCLPTIFTSNVPGDVLRERLGERVSSRLAEMSTRITLKGNDRRRQKPR